MIPRLQYGKVDKFDRKVINEIISYVTCSKRKRLPQGTVLYDIYYRYALESVENVPNNVKKECLTLVHYRSFYWNRVRFWQSKMSKNHITEKVQV